MNLSLMQDNVTASKFSKSNVRQWRIQLHACVRFEHKLRYFNHQWQTNIHIEVC